uniref:Phospholipase A2 hemilipin-2 (Fragments) n=1 Tax=Hemiscorpius lepturus TaxID=520031 RepID=HEMI2_HEMLE|nr:RecName: Full=Phospholipase A2 hemilipin-2; AltName: Full=Phosphatidylcholine 2-acylhydrolase; AltName: Full=Phospholipase A(2); Contains: RecName: Full=Hemilipin-2 large subunit; Contains: RecName: Full=Hemilipin-2 small subunit [Hemiscorpius lepturus]
DSLSEDNWKFVVSSSCETILEILDIGGCAKGVAEYT